MELEKDRERGFTLDLKSMAKLTKVSLNDVEREGTMVTGTIGRLVGAHFREDVVLEIAGDQGTIRVDLQENEIAKKSLIQKEAERR